MESEGKMTNKNGVYISKGNGSFKRNDRNDNSQVCQRGGSTKYRTNGYQYVKYWIEYTTNSLSEKANEFNGIRLKFNFKRTTRNIPALYKENNSFTMMICLWMIIPKMSWRSRVVSWLSQISLAYDCTTTCSIIRNIMS
jgi:hypothetical protein